jgi:hypothetical protein
MAWFRRARGSIVLRTVWIVATAACAAGDDEIPTGAAATGEPTGGGGDGRGGGDGQGGEGAGTTGTTASATGGSTTSGSTAGSGGGGGGAGGSSQGGGGAGPGAGGDGGAGEAGGGPPESGVVTVLATGASGAFRAARQDGAWTSSEVDGTFASGSRPALAMRGPAAAVGLVRAGSDTLLATTWSGATWTSPTPLGGAITTGDTPALASGGDGVAHATFHGALTDFHYYARHDGVAWSPDDEQVSAAGVDSFGPTPAAIAVVAGDPLIAYAGADENLYVQERGGAGWSTAIDVSGDASADATPAVTALAPGAGADVLVVFGHDTSLYWVRREPGGWTSPELVDDAFTPGGPSLAKTADGGAVLAFRGTNGGVYAALFDGDTASWSAPERVVAMVTTPSTPAVATGIGPAEAELVYVDAATGAVSHVRLEGSTWGDPSVLGGRDLTAVAAASSP